MSIEDVIARSRQPGAFVERKRFSVERANAIRKMRQFALADPHYYVLELIQSAVANGAQSIDLVMQNDKMVCSYVGGGYSEEELIKLFDFLFAAKSDMAYSALRQLALGVNALMLMSPQEILLESGDGTLEGTTLVIIRPGEEIVDVGTPERALDGTFVRASGLKRGLIRGKSNLRATEYGPPETRAIEERCLTLPIPIIVNDHSVFGFSSVRSPTLFGYNKVIAIDEGDLYGSLGFMELGQGPDPSFKLLTYGTWVQTVDQTLLPGELFGGIISYDRLNKTADHAAIVQDLRYEELWARLQPYARQLRYGAAESAKYEVSTLAGRPLSSKEIVKLLGEHDYALLVPASLETEGERAKRAKRIAASLDEDGLVPILRVRADDAHRIKYLSQRAQVIVPDLSNDLDQIFLAKPSLAAPARPWLIEPVKVKPLTIAELILDLWRRVRPDEAITRAGAEILCERLNGRWITLRQNEEGEPDVRSLYNTVEGVEDGRRHQINDLVAVVGRVGATLYIPMQALAAADETLVRIVASGRLLWAGAVRSAFPGFVIDVELDGVMPRHLEALPFDELSRPMPQLIAEAMVTALHDEMERATQPIFDNLRHEDVAPDTTAAQIFLGVLAREGHLKLVASENALPRFEIKLMRPMPISMVDVPVLRALDGTTRSLSQIVDALPSQGGLVYGVVDDDAHADLDGLNPARLLRLTLAQEELLMQIVGAAIYVRVDARDTLAMITRPQRARVRDMVLGEAIQSDAQRALTQRDLILDEPATLNKDDQRELIAQLIRTLHEPPSEDLNEEDLRRQALRHLQRFAVRRYAKQEDTLGLEHRELFVDLYGAPMTLEQLMAMSQRDAHQVMMGDGRALDVLRRHEARPDLGERYGLAMNPYVAMLLAPYVRVKAAFDFSLELELDEDEIERLKREHFLTSHEIEQEEFTGRLGIPMSRPTTRTSLLLRERDSGRCLALPSLMQDLGMVGVLEHPDLDAVDTKQAESLVHRHAVTMLETLLERLPDRHREPERWARATEALLTYAEQHLMLTRSPSHGVRYQAYNGLALRVLHMPLFDTESRHPISAISLLRSFCMRANGYAHATDLNALLSARLAAPLRSWLERNLSLERIVTQHDEPKRSAAERTFPSTRGDQDPLDRLEERVERLLRRFRPDEHLPIEVFAVRRDVPGDFSRLQAMPLGATRGWFDHQDGSQGLWARLLGRTRREQSDPLLYLFEPDRGRLCLDATHWLFAPLLGEEHPAQATLAWALLAIYAHINAVLDPVTNEHERQFHARIIEELEQGSLLNAP